MKKLAILTSILALAACGGGSGGGSYAPVNPENPDIVAPGENNGGTTQPDNGETTPENPDTPSGGENVVTGTQISDITAMRAAVVNKSQVINTVNQATTTGAKRSRAMAPQNNDLDAQYEEAVAKINQAKEILTTLVPDGVNNENLNNVIIALHLAGHTISDMTIDGVKNFISGEDYSSNGAIVAIDKIVSDATQTIEDVEFHVISTNDDGTPDTGILKMKTDGENISELILAYGDEADGKFTLTPIKGNKFEMVIGGGDTPEVSEGELVMLGKNHHLKYADFGYVEERMIEGDGPEGESSRHFLTGGYDVMKIDHTEMPSGEMVFSGTAVADMWNDAEDAHLNMQDDNATLTFNNGNETLAMKFDNWYNVKISNTGGEKSIAFDTTDKVIDERFQLTTASAPDNSKSYFGTTYYGDGTPSEATASFGYAEGQYISTDPDTGVDNTTLRAFTGAFGGAIQ